MIHEPNRKKTKLLAIAFFAPGDQVLNSRQTVYTRTIVFSGLW